MVTQRTARTALRYQALSWTLALLLFGAGEVLHLTLIHHSVQDPEAPTCSVCKMSEHNLGDLSPAPITGIAVDHWVRLPAPVELAGTSPPLCPGPSPRAPPRA